MAAHWSGRHGGALCSHPGSASWHWQPCKLLALTSPSIIYEVAFLPTVCLQRRPTTTTTTDPFSHCCLSLSLSLSSSHTNTHIFLESAHTPSRVVWSNEEVKTNALFPSNEFNSEHILHFSYLVNDSDPEHLSQVHVHRL